MGVQLRFGTAGATGGGWASQPGSIQPSLGEFRHAPQWQWQNRAPKTKRNYEITGWSFGVSTWGAGISGTDGAGVIGRDMTISHTYEPYSCDGPGTQSIKWIKGQCVDSTGAVAAGAVVSSFRTSDGALGGTVNANSTDGTFDVPTPYTGQAHYLVAYKPGAPDIAGTTVNTLIPTNIDGT